MVMGTESCTHTQMIRWPSEWVTERVRKSEWVSEYVCECVMR